MAIYTEASTLVEAVVEGFSTGLATVGFRVIDTPAGTTVVTRTTTGVSEQVAGSGIYAVSFTAPSSVGQYAVVWDTGGGSPVYATEELVVSSTASPQVLGTTPPGTGQLATFGNLLTEFYARGYDYLDDDGPGALRAAGWINDAMHELDDEELWPYRFATTSGAPPLTIADLGVVQSVTDTSMNVTLTFRDRRDLSDAYVDLSTTGSPIYAYFTDGTTLTTYPVGGTLSVSYYRVGPELTVSSDTPLAPARFHQAIIDGAVRRALYDTDNLVAAGAVEQDRQMKVERMRRTLLNPQTQDVPVMVDVRGAEDW